MSIQRHRVCDHRQVHLELIRTKDKEFPHIPEPEAYTTAHIWHCRYRTLAPLAAFVNLRELRIATYPDTTFELLTSLTRLEDLWILHMPRVTTLSPLTALTRLRCLELATLPSWDASGKVTQVDSLAPLAQLPELTEINLFGVRPPDKSVHDLLRCESLLHARISKYPKKEIDILERLLAERRSVGERAV